jgi:hypothetical protein
MGAYGAAMMRMRFKDYWALRREQLECNVTLAWQ